MIDKVIVATDLSESSAILVRHLKGLSLLGVKHILLLQCPSLQEVTSSAIPGVSQFQTNVINEQRSILEAQGFKVTTRISPGSPKREINRVAEQEGYPLIVVGSRGESLIAGAFLGGVAHEVILNARVPVLVIHLEVNSKKQLDIVSPIGKHVLDHILVATDFSPASEEAIALVENFGSKGYVGKVTLLHVQDKRHIEPHLEDRIEEFNATDRGRLGLMRISMLEQGIHEIDTTLRYGVPYTEILRTMEEIKPTLLVMGSQGRGFMRELFVGSVSQYVSRRSWIPVILVPVDWRKQLSS